MHWRLLPPEEKPWIACKFMTSVMTTLFCDLQGFTSMSEGVTPQGLAKIMNRYLSTMSEPIRAQHGVIDKYIGDAIMAYWGPPFNADANQAQLACLAAPRHDRAGFSIVRRAAGNPRRTPMYHGWIFVSA